MKRPAKGRGLEDVHLLSSLAKSLKAAGGRRAADDGYFPGPPARSNRGGERAKRDVTVGRKKGGKGKVGDNFQGHDGVLQCSLIAHSKKK